MLRLQPIIGPPSCLSKHPKHLVRCNMRAAAGGQRTCHQQQEALGWQASKARVPARLKNATKRTESLHGAQTWSERISQTILGALLSAVLAFSNTAPARPATAFDAANIQQLQETLVQSWATVEDKFVDPYDHELWGRLLKESSIKLAHATSREEGYAVIGSMLSSLGDQYTRILPPNQARVFKADTTGSVVHVGLQMERADTGAGPFMRASFVLTGSPAAAAGLHVGDIIHAINGRPAVEVDSRELTAMLHQGLQVNVQESRPGAPGALRNLYLSARPVEVYPVIRQALRRDDGSLAGYISIQSFSNNTAADTAHALSALASEGAGSYILDLRGNPGGLVSAGLDVAGLLLRRDDVFCYVMHKDGISTPILVETEAPLITAPLVVLVNGSTASTSEVLAGALTTAAAGGGNNSAPRAQLLGSHTFGKGRTQRVVPLSDTSTLLVSNALVTTPSHARLDKVGLEPAAHCAAGKGLPEALQREPVEADRLASDLVADPCVRAALRTLAQPPQQQQRM